MLSGTARHRDVGKTTPKAALSADAGLSCHCSWHLDCSQTNLLILLSVSLLYMALFLFLISTDCFCYHLIDGSCIKLMILCSTTLLFHFPFFPLPPLRSSNNLSVSLSFPFFSSKPCAYNIHPYRSFLCSSCITQPYCFSDCSAPSVEFAQLLQQHLLSS